MVTYCDKALDGVCGGACTVYNGGAKCLGAPNTNCLFATNNVVFCASRGCTGMCSLFSSCGTILQNNFCYTPGTASILVGASVNTSTVTTSIRSTSSLPNSLPASSGSTVAATSASATSQTVLASVTQPIAEPSTSHGTKLSVQSQLGSMGIVIGISLLLRGGFASSSYLTF